MSALARVYHGAQRRGRSAALPPSAPRGRPGRVGDDPRPGRAAPPRPGDRCGRARHRGAGAGGDGRPAAAHERTSPSPATWRPRWSAASCWAGRSTAWAQPLDGLPAPVGEARPPHLGRAAQSRPPGPAVRLHRDRHLRHRRHEHPGARPEAPGLLRARASRRWSWPREIVEGARAPHGEPFAVVFVGIGITARETAGLPGRGSSGAAPASAASSTSTRPATPPSSGCSRRGWRWPRPSSWPSRPACTCWW